MRIETVLVWGLVFVAMFVIGLLVARSQTYKERCRFLLEELSEKYRHREEQGILSSWYVAVRLERFQNRFDELCAKDADDDSFRELYDNYCL